MQVKNRIGPYFGRNGISGECADGIFRNFQIRIEFFRLLKASLKESCLCACDVSYKLKARTRSKQKLMACIDFELKFNTIYRLGHQI